METTSPLNRLIGEVVGAEIARRGSTPTAFARIIGVSHVTMAALVRGDAPWKATYMEAVAEQFGWDMRDILDRADPTGELTDFRPESVARRQAEVVLFPVPAPDEQLRDAAFSPRPEDDGEGEGLEFP